MTACPQCQRLALRVETLEQGLAEQQATSKALFTFFDAVSREYGLPSPGDFASMETAGLRVITGGKAAS